MEYVSAKSLTEITYEKISVGLGELPRPFELAFQVFEPSCKFDTTKEKTSSLENNQLTVLDETSVFSSLEKNLDVNESFRFKVKKKCKIFRFYDSRSPKESKLQFDFRSQPSTPT